MFIIAGIVLILLPKTVEYYYDKKEERLLHEAESLSFTDTNSPSMETPSLRSEYQQLSTVLSEEENEAEPSQQQQPPSATVNSGVEVSKRAIGIIEINKIDVKLPILEGATQANMRYAAVHLTESAPLGAKGNVAIAAHRARTKGRLFNKLHEVEVGDSITIRRKDSIYHYTVHSTNIVKPTDLSVLNPTKNPTLTLITCYPDSDHRLIVQAELEQQKIDQG